jgi:hypothetical protein
MAVQQNAVAEAGHAQMQQAAMAAQPPMDPTAAALMGHNGGPPLEPFQPSPEAVAGQALLADFQQGMERRKQIDKIGKTLGDPVREGAAGSAADRVQGGREAVRPARLHDLRRLCRDRVSARIRPAPRARRRD